MRWPTHFNGRITGQVLRSNDVRQWAPPDVRHCFYTLESRHTATVPGRLQHSDTRPFSVTSRSSSSPAKPETQSPKPRRKYSVSICPSLSLSLSLCLKKKRFLHPVLLFLYQSNLHRSIPDRTAIIQPPSLKHSFPHLSVGRLPTNGPVSNRRPGILPREDRLVVSVGVAGSQPVAGLHHEADAECRSEGGCPAPGSGYGVTGGRRRG